MLVHAFVLIALSFSIACQQSSAPSDPDVPVHVNLVAVDDRDLPVVVLEEKDGTRWLPIWKHPLGTATSSIPVRRSTAGLSLFCHT